MKNNSKCILEAYFMEIYEEALKKYSSLNKLEKMKRSLEATTADAYENFIKENGPIDKGVFLEGFHKFYDRVEREIREEELEHNDKMYLMEKMQKLDYEIYREKRDYLEPMKKYISLLTVFNLFVFIILGVFIFDRLYSGRKVSSIEKHSGNIVKLEKAINEDVDKKIIKEVEVATLDEKEKDIERVEIIDNGAADFLRARDAHQSRNFQEAYNSYISASRKGHERSNYILGAFYYGGVYIDQDYEKAVDYWKKASEANIFEADYSLGIVYIRGYGVEKNIEKAKEHLERAVAGEVLNAYYTLGNLYYLDRNYKRAAEIWEQGYKRGQVDSARSLANLYLYGVGVEKDVEKGRRVLAEIN